MANKAASVVGKHCHGNSVRSNNGFVAVDRLLSHSDKSILLTNCCVPRFPNPRLYYNALGVKADLNKE